jgi:hypothetical protein
MTVGRLVLAVIALAGGAAVLRAPALQVGSRAASLGEAREESAYALNANTVIFSIAAGVCSFRVLLNLDLDEGASPLRRVRVRVGPEGEDETFAVDVREALGGSPFYLDSAKRPSRTSVLAFERDDVSAGSIEVSLPPPSAGGGVVRVATLQRRALATAETAWAADLLPRRPSGRDAGFDREHARRGAGRAGSVGDVDARRTCHGVARHQRRALLRSCRDDRDLGTHPPERRPRARPRALAVAR